VIKTTIGDEVLSQISESLRGAADVVDSIRRSDDLDARHRLWDDFGLLLNQVDRLLPDSPLEI
jgi:hypothetical protein